eukprot:UN20687
MEDVQKNAVNWSENGAGDGNSYYISTHVVSGTIVVHCPSNATIRNVKKKICRIFYHRTPEEVILKNHGKEIMENDKTLLDYAIFKNNSIDCEFR